MSFMIIPKILWMTSVAALVASAATDLKERIIPNELAAAIAIAGLLISLFVRPDQIGASLAAAALVFVVLGVLCRYGVLGGGDVKLMAAVTLLVPPGDVGDLLTRIALAGGLLSSFYLGASYIIRPDSCDGSAGAVNTLVQPEASSPPFAAHSPRISCIRIKELLVRLIRGKSYRRSQHLGQHFRWSVLADWARLESVRIGSRKEMPYAVAILGGMVWYIAK